jgi:hypothetical protein
MDTQYTAILEALKQIHDRYPDLRFGEVIQSAVDRLRQGLNVNLHDVSSKELLSSLGDYQVATEEARTMLVKQERKVLLRAQLQLDKGMKP